jgi:F-type H+-transporting ATPase subunit epsilon
MADRLLLRVVTPVRQLLEQEVDEVRLPGVLGEMGVLPGHTPLLTSLATGPLSFTHDRIETRLVVQGGFAEVLPDAVTILARVAETASEIDVPAAQREATEIEAALKSASADDLDALTTRHRLATTRLEVAAS